METSREINITEDLNLQIRQLRDKEEKLSWKISTYEGGLMTKSF